MCKVIHTDFKPENVVIALADSQVEEISKTGQLTTSKLGKDSVFKRLNMKVAGTLKKDGDGAKVADVQKEIEERKEQRDWDNMTAKQKKNFKKKMQKLKKKAKQTEGASEMESEKPEEEEEEQEQETKPETKPQEKKKAVKGSLDRNLETGLLEGDDENE